MTTLSAHAQRTLATVACSSVIGDLNGKHVLALFPNPPMMTCCATARWKLPTKPSGSADKKWLFLISTSPLLFSSTLLVALANITRFTDLSTGTIPSFRTLLEYHMMIPHWAPTILDGYAYYGRPQKPRRLIFSATFYVHTSVAELRLTTQSVCYSPTACEMSLGKHIHSHYPNPAK